MPKNPADILQSGADTFRERHNVYGDNYLTVGRVMTAFFPDGLPLKTEDDHNRFHIFMLMVVKMTRYVENWRRGGHDDSLLDNAVYAAMLASIDQGINNRISDHQKWDDQSHKALERALADDAKVMKKPTGAVIGEVARAKQ